MSFRSRGPRAALLLASVVALSACGHATLDPAADDKPVDLRPVAGSDLKSVALSETSSARLGVRTADVTSAAGAPAGQVQVPYSSIVYDEQGATWTFVPTAPRTYVRKAVTVHHISGSVAVLSAGPAVGAQVVAVGSQELLGAELEISGEG